MRCPVKDGEPSMMLMCSVGCAVCIVPIVGTNNLFFGSTTADNVLYEYKRAENSLVELDRLVNLGPIVDMVCVEYGIRSIFVTCSGVHSGGSIGFSTLPSHKVHIDCVANVKHAKQIWPFTIGDTQYAVVSIGKRSRLLTFEADRVLFSSTPDFISPVETIIAFSTAKYFVHVSRTAIKVTCLATNSVFSPWHPAINDGEIVKASRFKGHFALVTSNNLLYYFTLNESSDEAPIRGDGSKVLKCDRIIDISVGSDLIVVVNEVNNEFYCVLYETFSLELQSSSVLTIDDGSITSVVLFECSLLTAVIVSTSYGKIAYRDVRSDNDWTLVQLNALGYPVKLCYSHETERVFVVSDCDEPMGVDVMITPKKDGIDFSLLWTVLRNPNGDDIPQTYCYATSFGGRVMMCTLDSILIGRIDPNVGNHARKIYLGESPSRIVYHKSTHTFVVLTSHRSIFCDDPTLSLHSHSCQNQDQVIIDFDDSFEYEQVHSSVKVVGYKRVERVLNLPNSIEASCLCTVQHGKDELIAVAMFKLIDAQTVNDCR
ncbi:hypothetical protein ACOME3_005496 [Neoechinorhynchus agilis]